MSRRSEKQLATRRRLDAALVGVRAWLEREELAPLLAQVAARPLPWETTGDPRSATSAAPQGCVGQGMGGTPMSTDVCPVPPVLAAALGISAPDFYLVLDGDRLLLRRAARATAQGIVTRMGQDLQGLGGAAIEPGPAGMRPACSGFDADCNDACATCGRARWRSAGAGAGAGQAPTIPDGNHGDNYKEATE